METHADDGHTHSKPREPEQARSKPDKGAPAPKLDPKAHRRLLAFLNTARGPDDLRVAPQDRIELDEEAHHMGGDHHGEEPVFLDRDVAKRLLEARDSTAPYHGFSHIDVAVKLHPSLKDLLPHLLLPFGAARYGRWDPLYPLTPNGTPFAIEHAAMLRSYEVLFLGDGMETLLWDPADETTPAFSLLGGAATGLTANLVCCGHAFRTDGQLLAVGGGGLGPGNPTSRQGWRFDPMTRRWNRTGDMATLRWYPTAVTLGDGGGHAASGRILVAAGGPGPMEMYSEATDSFAPVAATNPKGFPQTYPGLHLLPGGEMFYVPTGFGNCSTGSVYSLSDRSSAFVFTGPNAGEWRDIGPAMNRTKGMSALLLQPTYPFVRVVVVGGGDASTQRTAQTIDLSRMDPAWGPPSSVPDTRPRVNVNAVLLPDGKVLVAGGTVAPPHTTYIYDPGAPSNAWRTMDELNSPRHYHACMLLLPSGKVMAAGGAASGGCTVSVENSIEVFSPPYLFRRDGTPAVRPVIAKVAGKVPSRTTAPGIHYGGSFRVELQEPDCISRVVLVRPMAVTHQTDSEQRVVVCDAWCLDDRTIQVRAPGGPAPHSIAPPGHYMLFVFNDHGVPSEAKFVRLH